MGESDPIRPISHVPITLPFKREQPKKQKEERNPAHHEQDKVELHSEDPVNMPEVIQEVPQKAVITKRLDLSA